MLEILSRRLSLLALLAGLCWIGQGALQIGQYFGTEGPPFHHNALGLLLGEGSMLSRRLSMPIHLGAYLTTGLALIAFADRLNFYQEGRRNVALISAVVGTLAGLLGLAALTFGSLFPSFAAVPTITILMNYGILPISIAALLIGFGMWHTFDPLERWAARCIALFGLLTLSLAKLLSLLALILRFIPWIVYLFYIPVMLLVLPEQLAAYVGSFLVGPLWLVAALLIALGDKTVLSPARSPARTDI